MDERRERYARIISACEWSSTQVWEKKPQSYRDRYLAYADALIASDPAPVSGGAPQAFLMTGQWECSSDGTPGIWMTDPEGGDPHCLATIKRLYRPDALRAALAAAPLLPVGVDSSLRPKTGFAPSSGLDAASKSGEG